MPAELLPSGKVRCSTTGHEMPAQLDACQQYWNGNKYKNAKARARYDFSQHEPYIVAHKKDPNLLYCTLTKQPVSKMPKAVEGHVQGKRYKRLLLEAKQGVPEPTGKRQLKKRKRLQDGADAGSSSVGDGDGEGQGEEEEDDEEDDEDGSEDGDEDDDAAEFLAEGAFWEAAENAESEAKADSDDDEDAFWTRPKIRVGKGAGKKAKRQEQKRLKKAAADDDDDDDESRAPTARPSKPATGKGKARDAPAKARPPAVKQVASKRRVG